MTFHKTFLCLLGAFLLSSIPTWALSHTVQSGDTFYSLSRRYKVSVKELMSRNGVSDPRTLKIGQRLMIPGKSVPKKVTPNRKKTAEKKVSVRASSYRSSRQSLRVVVDAGHGGRDIGASWYGVNESWLNMRVARRVRDGLQKRGYPVTMTRTSDYFITLRRRAEIANRFRNAIFVSIHFNATTNTRVSGAETYYRGSKSRYLAKCIQSQLISRLRVKNRGVRYGSYSVLVGTKIPSVLVECGFISNSRERSRCRTNRYQDGAAQAIISGIVKYDQRY